MVLICVTVCKKHPISIGLFRMADEIVRENKVISCYHHGREEEFTLSFAKVFFSKMVRKVRFSAKSATM